MWSSADFATRWGCTIWLTCENVQGVKAFKFVNGFLFFFFFLISKNVIYTKGYSMHEEHRANLENTRRKTKKKTKKKTNPQINYKEKES